MELVAGRADQDQAGTRIRLEAYFAAPYCNPLPVTSSQQPETS
jgi:hypothetical protein